MLGTVSETIDQPSAVADPAVGKMDPREKLLVMVFSQLQQGRLTMTLPSGRRRVFEGTHPPAEHRPLADADIRLHSWKALTLASRSGSIGVGEGYMDQFWSSSNLTDLLALLLANMEVLESRLVSLRFFGVLARIRHFFNRNSKSGSRRNIGFHYDLGNDFYGLWLDKSMTYSAGVFATPETSLEEAQQAKYQRLIDQVGIRPGDHVLEIGCGWGGFAEYAARELGCRVTGLTLSKEQKAYAEQRIADQGLSDRCRFLLCDYRDMTGKFDHIVSIEMLEAVGQAYWSGYFQQVRNLLKPGGRAGIQVITIEDDRFENYRENVDFIQRYIFPGGMLVSDREMRRCFAEGNFELEDHFEFAEGYRLTLQRWHATFNQVVDAVKAQGFDDRFVRMWRFYLAYCEAGFQQRAIGVSHYVIK